MTKISYNSNNMMNYTLNSLKTGSEYLKKAYNSSSDIVVPSDFSEREYLKNLNSTLKTNSESLDKLKDWIVSNDIKYNNIVNEFEQSINSIDNVVISKRHCYISKK